MKRAYSKPTIHVEVMSLDMPVAAACDTYDESNELRAQGWFVGSDSCKVLVLSGDTFSGADTLCYHSHARTTLTS